MNSREMDFANIVTLALVRGKTHKDGRVYVRFIEAKGGLCLIVADLARNP